MTTQSLSSMGLLSKSFRSVQQWTWDLEGMFLNMGVSAVFLTDTPDACSRLKILSALNISDCCSVFGVDINGVWKLEASENKPIFGMFPGGDAIFWFILNCCCCEGKVPMPDAPEIPKLKVRKKSEILTWILIMQVHKCITSYVGFQFNFIIK